MGEAFEVALLSCTENLRYFVISYVLPVLAAIFDLPLRPTLMSESVHNSSAMLADLENVGVAFEILFPSCVQAEIYVFQVYSFSSFFTKTDLLTTMQCRKTPLNIIKQS